MAAGKMPGGLLHRCKVERVCDRVQVLALENIRAVTVPHTVDIGLAHAGEPCMEARLGNVERHSAYILRQHAPQPFKNLLRRHLCRRTERCYLHFCVRSGIRPARAAYLDRFAQYAAQGVF